MRVEIIKTDQLTPTQDAAIQALSDLVYPPDVPHPALQFQWSISQWAVLVWDEQGRLVSHVGIVTRDATYNDHPVHIGGIGSVMTHPDARRKGYAGAALKQAAAFINNERSVDFSQLVCEARLIPYYEKFGWQPFTGTVYVQQATGRQRFTFDEIMLLSGRKPAPLTGVLDLCGLPW